MSLDAEIAEAERTLSELERQRAATAARLAELRRRARSARSTDANGELSPLAKLAIFRDLFRGRDDLLAVRWENQTSGRSGYSPKCSNEWRPGVCGKPKVRCGACRSQAFARLGDRELLAHLRGHQVIGLYPLLPDDACRLLAIDLDGGSWEADARAIRTTCRSIGLEPTIERSRSGEGAHIWFFFSDPVPATDARRLGLAILTRTMASGVEIGIDSYDRLFPSQDVLPTGGFGNLIALPLQREARKRGNTAFLDEDMCPHGDQWSYLASVTKITPERLGELIGATSGDALAVRADSEELEAPWRPPRTLRDRLRDTRLPAVVGAVLADRVYLDRGALPPALAHAIRRLATFANPMFLEMQRLRRSVARTPRVVACFEDLDRHLAIPRGCLTDLRTLLTDLDVQLELRDERVGGSPLGCRFHGDLTESQRIAEEVMCTDDTGVLCAPPGWGKTVLAASLIAARGCSTLVLVHRKPLVEQWVQQLSELLGIAPKQIGTIGGGRRRVTGQLDVGMVQTLARTQMSPEALRAYGHVVIDECHHVPAVSIERVLCSLPARYVTGLTATPYRRDGHQPILTMQCGPIRHTVGLATTELQDALEPRVIRRDTVFDARTLPVNPTIQEIYTALAADDDRLKLVVGDVHQLLAERRAIIVLTERRDHLERLTASLRDAIPQLSVLHGGVKPKARRAALQHLAELSDDAPRLVLATGRYIGEGFDDPRLDTLLLTMPIAWKGNVVQYAGRLHRAHPAKHDIRIYDYVDDQVPVLRRMYAKRIKAYTNMGYITDTADRVGMTLSPSARATSTEADRSPTQL